MKVKLSDFRFSAEMLAMYGIELDVFGKHYDFTKFGFVSFPLQGSYVLETDLSLKVETKAAVMILSKNHASMQILIFPPELL